MKPFKKLSFYKPQRAIYSNTTSIGEKTMTDETTLLPCPWCGETPVYLAGKDGEVYIACFAYENHYCATGRYDDLDHAIHAWNRRYTEDNLR